MRKNLEVWRGEPYPLGATLTEEGVNFALYTEDATAVELCLFDSAEPDATELRKLGMSYCLRSGPGSSTDTVSTVGMNPGAACVSITASFY
jgi:pullulanase/glycogen debranching enzyme